MLTDGRLTPTRRIINKAEIRSLIMTFAKVTGNLLMGMCLGGAALMMAPSTYGDEIIDDFESYKEGQVVGKTYESKPWCRFGAATNDNIVATGRKDKVLNGKLSGQYGAYWPNAFGAARRVWDTPTDISSHKSAEVVMRSDEPTTQTRVRFAVSDGETTYASVDSVALAKEAKTLKFGLSEDDVILTDGTASYAEVMKNAMNVGFTFHSPEGQYTETILFDNFKFVDE
jgi:hypothetical protein